MKKTYFSYTSLLALAASLSLLSCKEETKPSQKEAAPAEAKAPADAHNKSKCEKALALYAKGEKDAALALLNPLVEQQYAPAYALLAQILWSDKSGVRDIIKCKKLAQAAIDADAQAPLGKAVIGVMRSETPLSDVSEEQALSYLQEGAAAGLPYAIYHLAMCQLDGKLGLSRDPAKAQQLMQQAAENNYAPAQYSTAVFYLQGLGVEKDSLKAVEWANKAIESNNADAYILLSQCYKKGEGVEKSEEKAFEYNHKAVAAGNPAPHYQIASAYATGKGTASNMELAQKHFLLAAENKDSDAMVAVAKFYYAGKVFEQDNAKSFEWASKAAAASNPEGQYFLAVLYQHGLGTEANLEKAKSWYSSAAAKGHAKAKEALEALK